VPISAFLLFLVSEVACREECAHFWPILPQLKNFSKNLSAHVIVILILSTTFVPNLTFLGILSPEIWFGEKTVTHPERQTEINKMTTKTFSALIKPYKKQTNILNYLNF